MLTTCYPDTTDWSCLSAADIAALDPIVKARAEMLAWRSVQRLSGGRVALCPTTIRPCAARCNPTGWVTATADGFGPYVDGGRWYNACGCVRRTDCSCKNLSEIVLPGEVGAPVVVRINGAVLNPTAYRVDNGNRLVRTDGEAWPLCQDMAAAPDEEGSFTVTYYEGVAPDDALSYAAGLLAVEWYKSCQGRDCALPAGATRVTRQGVSFEIATGGFDSGYSGIRAVDDIIGMYNPYRLKTPSVVLSPDSPRYRRRTA